MSYPFLLLGGVALVVVSVFLERKTECMAYDSQRNCLGTHKVDHFADTRYVLSRSVLRAARARACGQFC